MGLIEWDCGRKESEINRNRGKWTSNGAKKKMPSEIKIVHSRMVENRHVSIISIIIRL